MLLLFVVQLNVNAAPGFSLDLPREQGQIRARCEEALDPALDDKAAYESRHKVNCLNTLNSRTMNDLKDAFLVNCESTTRKRGEAASHVEISPDLIEAMLNDGYRPIFQKACWEGELKRHYSEQAGGASVAPEGRSPRIQDVYNGR